MSSSSSESVSLVNALLIDVFRGYFAIIFIAAQAVIMRAAAVFYLVLAMVSKLTHHDAIAMH
jgi:membrane protein required for beta-lactamase induction